MSHYCLQPEVRAEFWCLAYVTVTRCVFTKTGLYNGTRRVQVIAQPSQDVVSVPPQSVSTLAPATAQRRSLLSALAPGGVSPRPYRTWRSLAARGSRRTGLGPLEACLLVSVAARASCCSLRSCMSTCNQGQVKRLLISRSPLSGAISVMELGNARIKPLAAPLFLYLLAVCPRGPAAFQNLLLRNTRV